MKSKDPYAGMLLKLERIKQNKGQKEICFGICVPSYLSKIERNLVQADETILQELFERLNIRYCFEEKLITQANNLINEFFKNQFYGLDNEKIFRELKKLSASLNYSPLAIDWLLVQGFEKNKNVLHLLSQLEDVMSSHQLALYYIIQPLYSKNANKMLNLYKKAHSILENSYSLLYVIGAYFLLGQYDKVNECANQCISIALEEGNTWTLAECFDMQGCVYAALNVEPLMLQFYKRCINLLQNTLWKEKLSGTYYNIGATYLQNGKYELAMQYLNKVTGSECDFLLNHKKALVKIRSGHSEEAKEFLEIMKNWLLNKNDVEVEKLMYEETLMEMNKNFLSNPHFISLLEKLMLSIKTDKHLGYYLFYRDLLKEAYCKQRKYKKALELK